MLRIRQSNRLDALADALIDRLAAPGPRHPLDADTVVVQSPGMATWLRHRLAERVGIAAAVDFPLPSTLLWRVIRALVPEAQIESPYRKQDMAWRLVGLLDPADAAFSGEPSNAPLLAYLADDHTGLKRHQLAQRIADVFDQYLVYRPDWMCAWRDGDERPATGASQWQPRLWRRLVAATGNAPDRALLQQRACERLERADAGALAETLAGTVPASLSVFGISALPPEQLRLLLALGRHRDVDVHVFNPCRHYWADLVSEPWLARRVADELLADAVPTHPYYEVGHPLLGALGRAGRDFVDLLLELGEHADVEDAFVEPDASTTLGRLQADLLDLEAPETQVAVPADDASLCFADCHGPQRELEALHDWLLGRFEADPALTPRDVVVMIPDVDRYAPCIDAVFGGGDDVRRIPYTIADRGGRSEAPILEAVAALLRLPRSRRTVSEVLGILETPAVARAFGLGDGDLEQLAHWLEEAGVRWGRDAAHWRSFGAAVDGGDGADGPLPNTWASGVERMLLGYAVGDDASAFRGIVPLGGVEGSPAEAVGGLLSFLEALDRAAGDLAGPHAPAIWARRLGALLDEFLEADADEALALGPLRETLAELERVERDLGVAAPLHREVVEAVIEPVLQAPAGAHRFLAGGVTFCTLMPMRTIPFRVVALLGMNDADYPRQETPLGFDLLPRFPRKGDRARRLEDRYLFLEAILAARDHLYVSWTGHSPTDDSVRPPSVVVSELRDALERRCVVADGDGHGSGGEDGEGDVDRAEETDGGVLAACTVRHRLQPFSGDYAPDGLATYSTLWGRAPGATAGRARPVAADLGPAPVPDPLALEALVRAFLDPSAAFLATRLDVRLDVRESGDEDEEPFVLAGLERYRVRREALDALLDGEDLGAWSDRARRAGRLPHGGRGEDAMAEVRSLVDDYRMRFGALLTDPADRLPVDIEVAGVRIVGDLDGALAGVRRVLRIGEIRARDRLRLWIEHLASCVAGAGRPSVLLDAKALHLLPPLDEARATGYLEDLLTLRATVLRAPEPLFVDASLAWVTGTEKSESAARSAVRSAWNTGWAPSGRPPPGEGDGAAVARLWPRCPVDDADLMPRFEALASRLWAPIVATFETLKDDEVADFLAGLDAAAGTVDADA